MVVYIFAWKIALLCIFCAGSGIRNKLFASFKIWINVDFLQNSVYNIDHATAAKVGPKSDKAAENTITSSKLFVPIILWCGH